MKVVKEEHVKWLKSLKNEVCPEFPSVWHVAVKKYGGDAKYYALCVVKAGVGIRRNGKLYLLATDEL